MSKFHNLTILRKTPSFSSAAFVSGQGGFACQEQAARKPRRKKRVVFPWLPWPGTAAMHRSGPRWPGRWRCVRRDFPVILQ